MTVLRGRRERGGGFGVDGAERGVDGLAPTAEGWVETVEPSARRNGLSWRRLYWGKSGEGGEIVKRVWDLDRLKGFIIAGDIVC